MMELGNWVFGHSRGEFPIPRSEGWEVELFRLFDAYAPGEDNSYGPEFENGTFWVTPYYWGDCTCGWDYFDDGHERLQSLKHSPDCYWYEYKQIHEVHDELLKRLRPLYEKYGWPTEGEDWWHGCAVRCTCDYEQRYDEVMAQYVKEFGHEGHWPECPLVKPNFYHKPSGFSLMWYKYPLRSSFANQEITLVEFSKIIDDCIEGLL
jgi:hypothetical protein